MSDQARLVAELRELIAKKEVVLVVGTGVSVSATEKAPTASWKGLLLSGVKWCEEMKPALSGRWAERRRDDIENGASAEMIAAADLITDELNSLAPGEFKKWLKHEVGSLHIQNRSVHDALMALNAPFATTNYDHLIEEAMAGQSASLAVGWKDRDAVETIIREWNRGEFRKGVLHLHGKYDQPESVILGIKSYETVKNDEHAQAVLKWLRLGKNLLFVGCAGGLGDPNFGNFLSWTRPVFAESTFYQYCLVCESEQEELQAQHPLTERIVFLSYGKEFDDLAPFLKTLAPQPTKAGPSRRGANKKTASKPATLPPAVAGYLKRLAEETRYLRMIGLAENLQIDLEIKDAYVPLRTVVTRSLTGRRQGRFAEDEFKEAGQTEENIPLAEMFTVARRYQKRGVILLGEPGAGKTTGARQLCWMLASGAQSPVDLGLPRGVVPVLLQFRNLQDDHVENGFKDFVLRETRDDDAPEAESNPGPELWNGEPRLWIFDGLDEVVSEAVRIKVSQRLQDFLRHRSHDCVLVTSRYQGYGDKVDLGPGFIQFHVRPLKADQVETFVDKWFCAAYQELYGDKPKAAKEAAADAANLKRILSQSEYSIGGLRELRTNPLLLTVVCLVYHQKHSLPRGRATLYENCVTVLLGSWRKGLYDQQRAAPYDPRAAQRVLAHLAWWMHCQSEGEAGGKDESEQDRRGSPAAALELMAEAVAKPLAETAQGAGLGRDGRRFIERMRDESGILVTSKPGHCSFLHLTFQEYLAATHAVEEGRSAELVERLGQSWWREVILLALARANGPFAKAFFSAFLNSPTWATDMNLASRCLDETAVTVLDPFLDQLKNPEAPVALKLRVLQLLRHRSDPALVEACRTLAGQPETLLASAALEILERAQITVEIVGKQVVLAVGTIRPGEIQVDSRTGIAFVRIPAGEFDMGANAISDREKPIHRVRLSSSFLLGRYPVTNQEYERFLKETECKNVPGNWDDKSFNQPQQPVVGVSWDDALLFCEWAGCRLPTEAEWEYACRAGTTTEFYFGDSLSSTQANFNGNHPFGKAKKGPYLEKTSPAGSYEPNGFGLYDMHGNVWEWCQDWYAKYLSGAVIDPKGPEEGPARVLRGGSWDNFGVRCRSAYRYVPPSIRINGIGFRVVLAPRSVP